MQQYSDETKAAVLAAIASGTSILNASRQFKVPRSTVRTWCRSAGLSPLVTPEKKQDLGALVARYLTAGLETLEAQARLFADPEWVKKQSAGELAVLHGVLADKLIRVLSAVEPDASPGAGA